MPKEEEEKKSDPIPELSPRSKRLAAWDQEDSDSSAEDGDPNFPDICFCQICNAEMDSPEAAQEHMSMTFHKNLEMISSVNTFREESISSHILFKQQKKKGIESNESDWLDHLKKEFFIIFEEEDKDSKIFDFFQSKIVNGMEEQDSSLFDNIALKNEIFTFILAQKKQFKCNYCMSEPFKSV